MVVRNVNICRLCVVLFLLGRMMAFASLPLPK
jgi:hypothetical protein